MLFQKCSNFRSCKDQTSIESDRYLGLGRLCWFSNLPFGRLDAYVFFRSWSYLRTLMLPSQLRHFSLYLWIINAFQELKVHFGRNDARPTSELEATTEVSCRLHSSQSWPVFQMKIQFLRVLVLFECIAGPSNSIFVIKRSRRSF